MATATTTTTANPPILTHSRLLDYGASSGVTGRYTSDSSRAEKLQAVERPEPITYVEAEELQRMQQRLIKRALAQPGGEAAWSVQSDLSDFTLLGSNQHLVCPACGGENLHQLAIVSTENPSERITIAFACEHCPAEPHLHLTQHKGITSLFWDAEMLLKDFGVYEEVQAVLNARALEFKRRLEARAK